MSCEMFLCQYKSKGALFLVLKCTLKHQESVPFLHVKKENQTNKVFLGIKLTFLPTMFD
jgi:hypothetical protein